MARPDSTSSRRRLPPRRQLLVILLLPLAALAVYARSLSNELVWDDRQLVVQNRHLRQGDVAAIVEHGIFSGAGRSFGFYRPAQILSYALDLRVWGDPPLRPWTLRLTNLLLHALNTLLVYGVLRALFPRRRRAAWCAAALFAVHPAATAAVAYVAGRADLLLLSGSLGSLLLLARAQHGGSGHGRWLAMAGSYLCYALALFSKELALIVPALIALALWLAPGLADAGGAAAVGTARTHAGWRRWRPLAGHLLLLAASLWLRLGLLGIASTASPGGGGPVTGTARVVATYLAYARLLLWPDVLQMERLELPDPWRDPGYLLPWLALAALAAALLARRATRRPAVFGLAWFAIALFPVANVWRLNAAMAEHWLYLPAIGIFWLAGLLAASLAARGRRTRAAAAAVLALALLALAARTAVRCGDWRSSRTIFAATVAHAPGSARAHTGLGAALGREGRLDEAIGHLRRALALDPANADALNNLGAAFGRQRQLDSCVVYLERALALEPENADTYTNLGNAYALRGQPARALRAYQEAQRLDPARATVDFNLGRVYQRLGETAAARAAYARFLGRSGGREDAQTRAARSALAALDQQLRSMPATGAP